MFENSKKETFRHIILRVLKEHMRRQHAMAAGWKLLDVVAIFRRFPRAWVSGCK